MVLCINLMHRKLSLAENSNCIRIRFVVICCKPKQIQDKGQVTALKLKLYSLCFVVCSYFYDAVRIFRIAPMLMNGLRTLCRNQMVFFKNRRFKIQTMPNKHVPTDETELKNNSVSNSKIRPCDAYGMQA